MSRQIYILKNCVTLHIGSHPPRLNIDFELHLIPRQSSQLGSANESNPGPFFLAIKAIALPISDDTLTPADDWGR